MTDVPHFSLPFRFATPQAAVTEQDSLDEIADCCLAIMVCPQGFRVELPEFGIVDPTFSMPEVDLDALRTAIERWEPRAAAQLEQEWDPVDQALVNLRAFVQLRTEE